MPVIEQCDLLDFPLDFDTVHLHVHPLYPKSKVREFPVCWSCNSWDVPPFAASSLAAAPFATAAAKREADLLLAVAAAALWTLLCVSCELPTSIVTGWALGGPHIFASSIYIYKKCYFRAGTNVWLQGVRCNRSALNIQPRHNLKQTIQG